MSKVYQVSIALSAMKFAKLALMCALVFSGPLVLYGLYDLILWLDAHTLLGFCNYIILLHVFDVSSVYRYTLYEDTGRLMEYFSTSSIGRNLAINMTRGSQSTI